MVRLYGNEPYKVVLVHGGPGVIGSLKGFAKELSIRTDKGVEKVTLIGHSWGAWLVALLAEKYPEVVKCII